MPVDWKAPDSFNRLLAALYASMDGQMKLNYKRIADYYGEGATYDAIEGRFRIIKKQAQKLKEEVENGRPIAPPRGTNRSAESTPRKPKTPRNNNSQDGVLTGRISKSNQSSPTKRRSNAQVKREMMESASASTSASSVSGNDVETPSSGEGADMSNMMDQSFCDMTNFSYDPSSFHISPLPEHPNQMLHNDYSSWGFDDNQAV